MTDAGRIRRTAFNRSQRLPHSNGTYEWIAESIGEAYTRRVLVTDPCGANGSVGGAGRGRNSCRGCAGLPAGVVPGRASIRPVYQALLTRKYLFSKLMPLLASLAVALLAATTLVVWSVMTGFLVMLLNTGRTMTGDVVVRWSNTGFAHYEELIEMLEKDPAVLAAAPMIETFGLLGLPNGRNSTVILRGVDGARFAEVTRYEEILWWRPQAKPLDKDVQKQDPRLNSISPRSWEELLASGKSLTRRDLKTGEIQAGIVPGIEVTGFNAREPEGFYSPRVIRRTRADGSSEIEDMFLPQRGNATVTTVALDSQGQPVESVSRMLPVCNEFQSGVYQVDSSVVLINITVLQDMLKMTEARRLKEGVQPTGATRINPETGREEFVLPGENDYVVEPARVTDVLVRSRGDAGDMRSANALKATVRAVYREFAAKHKGEVPEEFDITIQTWEEQNAFMINAVKKEIGMLLVIFLFISVVAIFLVFAIFWSMVREKTQDIGILRSLGASRSGVAWLWVCYGIAIGVVGSIAGVGLAHLFMWKINEIHEWLGTTFSIVVWDPRVYYFVKLPTGVDSSHAVIVFVIGVVSCALGAFVPALRAAKMNPVRALRNE